MDMLAHKYKGKAKFIFCNKDGPGKAADYVSKKGLEKDGVLEHVDGRGNSQAYQVKYAAHKSLFDKDGVLKANNQFNLERELQKVL
jgi:hypothetical protein